MSNEKEFYKQLGKDIRELRRLACVSQIELAEELGLHQAAISRIESGKYCIDYYKYIKLIEYLEPKVKWSFPVRKR